MIEEKLQNFLLDLETLKEPEIYHRDFGTWGGKAIRRLSEIFSKDSLQVGCFKRIKHVTQV